MTQRLICTLLFPQQSYGILLCDEQGMLYPGSTAYKYDAIPMVTSTYSYLCEYFAETGLVTRILFYTTTDIINFGIAELGTLFMVDVQNATSGQCIAQIDFYINAAECRYFAKQNAIANMDFLIATYGSSAQILKKALDYHIAAPAVPIEKVETHQPEKIEPTTVIEATTAATPALEIIPAEQTIPETPTIEITPTEQTIVAQEAKPEQQKPIKTIQFDFKKFQSTAINWVYSPIKEIQNTIQQSHQHITTHYSRQATHACAVLSLNWLLLSLVDYNEYINRQQLLDDPRSRVTPHAINTYLLLLFSTSIYILLYKHVYQAVPHPLAAEAQQIVQKLKLKKS